jgi:hypothetical protein
LNDHVLRLVGLAFVGWAAVVTAASVTTEYGLSVTGDATNAAGTDLAATGAVVEFSLAHPGYPALLAVGLVLLAFNDDAPLLGS